MVDGKDFDTLLALTQLSSNELIKLLNVKRKAQGKPPITQEDLKPQ